MKFKFLKHKWQKIVFNFVLIPVAIIFFIAIILNQYLSPILATKVREAVLAGSDSLYRADFSKAELHLLEGKVTIFNISLTPDTAVFNRKKRQHLAPNNLVTLHVKRLILLHVHPFSYYLGHKLKISKIILNQPELNISYQLNHTKDTIDKDHQTSWQKISKSLHSIQVEHIYFNDVKFKYEDYSGHKVVISELKEMNLSATDLLIDSATQTDKSRLLYCKDIITELNNYAGKTSNGLYDYKIKYLRLSTQTSRLTIQGLQLEPAKTNIFFNKSKSDRFTLGLDSLRLNNFDFLRYHKYRVLTASSLELNGGTLRVFGNPNKQKRPAPDKISTFPNMIIRTTNADLSIDTARLSHINVEYSEFNNDSKKTGTVSFNNTSGYFNNITTNEKVIEKNNFTTAKLSTYFMNRGRLDVQFMFNLTDKDAAFSYKGILGPMEASKINQASVPLAMVKITSGDIRQFSFDIQANSKAFKGNVTLLYNNLKISLLKADTANNQLKKQALMSIFANLFVIKHNNPDDIGKAPRTTYVNYLRPKDSPFFKTLWRTLLDGIKPAVGLDKKTQRATNQRIAEHNKNKQERLIKKAERKKRKAEKKAARELKGI